ncbi:hypothetical protein CNEO4_510069 [Clostridium neonatale]|uniref:Uncharacterized protein n=1 Tax=Clostridium neonatale TaxID=137838 RepID=A0AA86K052_9CLOT|nr:hypothetical protein CNEO_45042 [Clostridium neonatale]CAI3240182.1 hypothetical protein CNEO2_20160 [Clostridium neonatale]CAI3537059.1 hypothetical protein CNEO3_110017 [Clostridium neonatale]CAI3540526.1 hypothetical protein CNEO4_190005 [Clostridium neonatale]CAI3577637.1 hypothetical protein CNEO3_130015 [Clostridium neonatale]
MGDLLYIIHIELFNINNIYDYIMNITVWEGVLVYETWN